MAARKSLSRQVDRPRCGVYCRISSDDAHDELGVKRQERNCRRVVETIRGTVSGVYVDNDQSAAAGSKPRHEFERLIADLKGGLLDVVVVQNQDRISRDNVEVELFMRLLRSLGQDHYWSASAGRVGIKTTNERLGYRVKGLFDTSYSEYVSEKVLEHKADLAEAGLPAGGGLRAFGWSCHTAGRDISSCTVPGCRHDGGMSLVPSEAAGLRRAADVVRAGGTLEAATKAVGVPTVSGKPWHPQVVKSMLLSPRIAGRRVHQGEIIGDAAWPAILQPDEWEEVKAELAERYRPSARPRRHLLSGGALCGVCDRPLAAQWAVRSREKRRRVTYWCRKARGGCGKLTIAGDKLEAVVLDEVGRWLNDPDLADDITAILQGDDGAEVDELLKAIRVEEANLVRFAREREELDLELFEYQAMRAPAKQRLADARQRLTVARRTAAAATPLGAVTVAEIAAAWPKMSVEGRREVITVLAGEVKVMPVGKQARGWMPERVKIRPAWEAAAS